MWNISKSKYHQNLYLNILVQTSHAKLVKKLLAVFVLCTLDDFTVKSWSRCKVLKTTEASGSYLCPAGERREASKKKCLVCLTTWWSPWQLLLTVPTAGCLTASGPAEWRPHNYTPLATVTVRKLRNGPSNKMKHRNIKNRNAYCFTVSRFIS